jgi:uncharacterized protein (TIGR00251 family)
MILEIKVKTGSNKQRLEKISESQYKISLKSLPESNKANKELLKLLKKEFGREARIIKGMKSREKIIKLGE